MTGDRVGNGERAWLRPADAFILATVVAIAAVALAQSWNRWLDPIVDAGRDLYIPEQLRYGTKLYRDIVYFYPPLTPLLLALVTAVVGSSLSSYAAIGIVIAGLTMLLLYSLGRVVADRAVGGFAAALFAACSIATPWSRGGNYIAPYAHAATLAMLFFVGFACFFGAYLFVSRRPSFLVAALLCALAASWTKVEFAAFTTALLIVFTALHRISWRWIAAYAAAFAAVAGFVSQYFGDSPPDRTWFRGNVFPESMLGSRSLAGFYATVAGLQGWPSLLMVSLIGAAVFGAIVLLLRWAEGPRRWPLLVLAAIVAIAFGASQMFFRAWSILEIIVLVIALRRPREPLLFVTAFALCASSRIPLNIAPQWYGFVFCVPVYLLIAYFVVDWLPSHGVYSRQASKVWALAFAAAVLQWMVSANIAYAAKTHQITTPRGVVLDNSANRASILNQASAEIRRRGIRAIAFFPEGLALNYLWKIPTPLAYYTFTPAETASTLGETHALADLSARRPEWIAIVARDVSEFGYRGFGIDYDLRLSNAIRSGYRLEHKWSSPDFELLLLQRKGSEAGATMQRSVPRE